MSCLALWISDGRYDDGEGQSSTPSAFARSKRYSSVDLGAVPNLRYRMDKVLSSQKQEKQGRLIFSIEGPLRTKQGVWKLLALITVGYDNSSVLRRLISDELYYVVD